MSACTTPLSWLVIERYHLGELPPSEHDSVAAHLGACVECKALLARIAEDDACPLPALEPPPTFAPARRPGARIMTSRAAGIAASLALAATVMLAIGRQPKSPAELEPLAHVKGDGVSFVLVREDEATIDEAGGAYRDGERFKAVVTCPPGMRASFDVAVFERDQVAFPLLESTNLACGNSVPLPGAFRATGAERMTVCLVWRTDGVVDRDEIRHASPGSVPRALCKSLEPAP